MSHIMIWLKCGEGKVQWLHMSQSHFSKITEKHWEKDFYLSYQSLSLKNEKAI